MRVFLCACLCALLVTACAPRDGAAPAPAREGTRVIIQGIAFEPDEITIGVGDRVTWLNKDEVDHTVTSGKAGKQGIPGVKEGTEPRLDGLFDDALPTAGSTFSFTFDEPGTYSYFCDVHASMRGVVTVE